MSILDSEFGPLLTALDVLNSPSRQRIAHSFLCCWTTGGPRAVSSLELWPHERTRGLEGRVGPSVGELGELLAFSEHLLWTRF